jgi:hypothetical protein
MDLSIVDLILTFVILYQVIISAKKTKALRGEVKRMKAKLIAQQCMTAAMIMHHDKKLPITNASIASLAHTLIDTTKGEPI